jgi:hypothetical protein
VNGVNTGANAVHAYKCGVCVYVCVIHRNGGTGEQGSGEASGGGARYSIYSFC